MKSVARAIELDKLLVSCNFPSISIHSGLQQEERFVCDYQKLYLRNYTCDLELAVILLSKHSRSESLLLLISSAAASMLNESISSSIMIALLMRTATCIALGTCVLFLLLAPNLYADRRAGRFGTKGLAITFVSSESDQQVMSSIQSRFEVAVPELPEHIDPASYSKCRILNYHSYSNLLQ